MYNGEIKLSFTIDKFFIEKNYFKTKRSTQNLKLFIQTNIIIFKIKFL